MWRNQKIVVNGTVCTYLYELVQFPLTTLIRLYEFLKNSRVHWTISVNIKEPSLGRLFDIDMVEDDGIEPTTPCLQSRCSPSWANPPFLFLDPFECNQTDCCQIWWVWLVSNQRPPPYQDGALTNWATDPSRSLKTKAWTSVVSDNLPTTDKCERSN